jgi:hypothetical protein
MEVPAAAVPELAVARAFALASLRLFDAARTLSEAPAQQSCNIAAVNVEAAVHLSMTQVRNPSTTATNLVKYSRRISHTTKLQPSNDETVTLEAAVHLSTAHSSCVWRAAAHLMRLSRTLCHGPARSKAAIVCLDAATNLTMAHA